MIVKNREIKNVSIKELTIIESTSFLVCAYSGTCFRTEK